jgi:perosamine synthetase
MATDGEMLAVPGAEAPATSLAMNGGPKAVKERASPLVRWGEAERQQLNAVVGQDSLFY